MIILPGTVPAEEAPAAQRDSAEGIRSHIHALWFARKEALDRSDTVGAQARVEELKAYLSHQGITADEELARGLAYEGYENLREGNYERAREAFDIARTLDPFLPQAQTGYAWSLLRSGRGVTTFVNEYLKGIRLSWERFRTDEIQIANFGVVAALAVFCSLTVFSLVVIARCQGRLRHDLKESFLRLLPQRGARLAAWTVFLLPLIVWTGGVWLVLYWLALCFRYMRIPEKAVAVSVFLMIGFAPFGVTAVLDRFEATTDPEMRVVISAMQSGYNPESVRSLEQVVSSRGDRAELHLLLGTAYSKGDRLAEAFDAFQRVLELRPTSTAALIDLGNIYFRLGEYGQAANHYKQALQIQPDLASAYWNLYLAQTEMLHFAEADASLAQARDLGGARVGELLARKKGEGGARLLIEEAADLTELKRDVRASGSAPAERLRALVNPVSFASGATLVFALLMGLGRGITTAQACLRCGKAFCFRCRVEAGGAAYCARCTHLFLKKDGIAAEVRAEEAARLSRRDRVTTLVRRSLSLLLPGSGQILAGRIAIGFPVMTGWVSTLIYLLTRDRLLLTARVPVTDLPAPGIVAAVGLMALLWILGNAASSGRRLTMGEPHGA